MTAEVPPPQFVFYPENVDALNPEEILCVTLIIMRHREVNKSGEKSGPILK